MGCTKDVSPQKMSYEIEIDKNNCMMSVIINETHVVGDSSKDPVEMALSIGEYLKPTNNRLRLVVAPPNSNGKFEPDSFCKVSLAGRDRFTNEIKVFGGINYFPTESVEFNSSKKAIKVIPDINTDFGLITEKADIQLYKNSKRTYYKIRQQFDLVPEYREWSWVNSQTLSDETGYAAPLSKELNAALVAAYKELWDAFNRKDLKKLKELHHEYISEGADYSGLLEDDFYNSLELERFFKKSELSLAPLSLEELQYFYSYDGKVVELDSDGVDLIHFIKNDDKSDYIAYCPRFRFDGKKFVITR